MRAIGHFKTLSEESSRIELLKIRDYLFIHGVEKSCRIKG